jgi:peptidoglycan/LPS O-acetylase OafA/YrhL
MASNTHQRFPHLDGIRPLAVLLVALFHRELCAFGWLGVQIFFVLSGFLITRILVQARGSSFGVYLRNFYGRRSLRIFPLYFSVVGLLALAVAAGISMDGVREGLIYAATYTYNVFHATNQFKHSKMITHFWSLCVEEQFYLVWPFLLYFTKPPAIRRTLAAIVLAGPLVRLVTMQILKLPGLPVYPRADVALYVLTPSHLDAFAIGGYAALFPLGASRRKLFGALALLLAAGSIVIATSNGADGKPLAWGTLGYPLGLSAGFAMYWGYSLINVCSVLLIDCVACGDFAPRFFGNRIMSYLGKISYGLYVFHYPFQSLVNRLLPGAPLLLQIFVQFSLTIAVASASFHLWEARFTKLKDIYFPSSAADRQVRAEPSASPT